MRDKTDLFVLKRATTRYKFKFFKLCNFSKLIDVIPDPMLQLRPTFRAFKADYLIFHEAVSREVLLNLYETIGFEVASIFQFILNFINDSFRVFLNPFISVMTKIQTARSTPQWLALFTSKWYL